jgi:flagellar protein FliS
MTNEMKQVFTRRITQANRTQLLVVVYDMLIAYIDDGIKAQEVGNETEFKRSLELARDCIADLRCSLDFEYELSKNLFSIYAYADRELSNDIYGYKTDNLEAIKDMFQKLREAYHTVSKEDKSEPLMENTQDVYAGFTYGRTDVNETLGNFDSSRGYSV